MKKKINKREIEHLELKRAGKQETPTGKVG